MASLGNRIKELREQKNLTQRELAEIMGYKTTRSVQFLEANQRNLDHHQLVALANYFNVSVDYLLGISDEPNPATRPEEGIEYTYINKPGIVKEQTEGKYGKRDQADKKPGHDEIDMLIEELDEESVAELKKYAEYLKVRQTLDSNKDEKSAGLDGERVK